MRLLKRRIHRSFALFASSFGLLLATSGCSSDSPAPADTTLSAGPTPAAPAPPGSVAPTPFAQPTDGGALRIVEQGFTATSDGKGAPWFSVGFVVENTSAFVATKIRVALALVDTAGQQVPYAGPRPEHVIDIPVVLARQRLVVGVTEPLKRTGAADLRITVGPARWWVADRTDRTYREIHVSRIRTETDGSGRTDWAFWSESELSLARVDAYILLRDKNGRIIGGQRSTGETASEFGRPHTIGLPAALPPGIDYAKTEISMSG
ncbi:hypothetical protein [Yinghuangia sp. YIM S09857]|uniref:hypothetical protein n=1 Tax=Yinghuangia sp. YIM S09857 TaxID=3436929 RepID=UPI003F53B093